MQKNFGSIDSRLKQLSTVSLSVTDRTAEAEPTSNRLTKFFNQYLEEVSEYTPTQPQTSVSPKEKLSQPVALIVDDSIVVREMTSMSLTEAGYQVKLAKDGQQAWELLNQGITCHLIFCDIQMPRMNGLELLSKLKNESNLSSIPVAMLTSRATKHMKQIAKELGAVAYLTKPYLEEDLLDLASRLVNNEMVVFDSQRTENPKIESEKVLQSTAAPEQTSVSPNETLSQPVALIVDDSIVVREMTAMSLTKAGYQVKLARDGQQAWELLKKGLICDSIFCDIEMPKMNGLELLSKLKNEPNLSSIPVAMLTSRSSKNMKKIAAELGAVAYLTKPYLEEDLLDIADRCVNGELTCLN